jgi:hypothetical protein
MTINPSEQSASEQNNHFNTKSTPYGLLQSEFLQGFTNQNLLKTQDQWKEKLEDQSRNF